MSAPPPWTSTPPPRAMTMSGTTAHGRLSAKPAGYGTSVRRIQSRAAATSTLVVPSAAAIFASAPRASGSRWSAISARARPCSRPSARSRCAICNSRHSRTSRAPIPGGPASRRAAKTRSARSGATASARATSAASRSQKPWWSRLPTMYSAIGASRASTSRRSSASSASVPLGCCTASAPGSAATLPSCRSSRSSSAGLSSTSRATRSSSSAEVSASACVKATSAGVARTASAGAKASSVAGGIYRSPRKFRASGRRRMIVQPRGPGGGGQAR